MPGNPLTDPTLAADAADTVERVVGTVRDKAIVPIVRAARAVVFGLLAAFLGFTIVLLVLIALIRGVQILLDFGMPWSRAVYVSYFVIGGIFSIAGLWAMSKRKPEPA